MANKVNAFSKEAEKTRLNTKSIIKPVTPKNARERISSTPVPETLNASDINVNHEIVGEENVDKIIKNNPTTETLPVPTNVIENNDAIDEFDSDVSESNDTFVMNKSKRTYKKRKKEILNEEIDPSLNLNTTLRIEPSTNNLLRLYCLKEKMNLSDIANIALKKYLNEVCSEDLKKMADVFFKPSDNT